MDGPLFTNLQMAKGNALSRALGHGGLGTVH
jgi:hypothetical protein